ncbi:MAG: EAL domain-containing protein [Thermoanaerobaculia bacterium]
MPTLAHRPARRLPLVLIVDDDEGVGAYVQSALRKERFRTIWAPTVEEALRLIDEEPPDLALLDIGLRNTGSGLDVLARLRDSSHTEHIPIVMLTGSSDTIDRKRSLEMGADRYLIKPVRPETLRRVVTEMLSAHDDVWWSLTLQDHQVDRLRELFFDETTDLPTLALVVEDLRKIIEGGERLQVFCLEIEPLFRFGARDHWDSFDALRKEFVRGLRVLVAPLLGNDAVIATSHAGGNDFYCFARTTESLEAQVQMASELERYARNGLKSLHVDESILEEIAVFAGGAITEPPSGSAPRVLYNAVREAKDSAEKREIRYLHGMRERLTRAIRESSITTVFQPIIDLRKGTVVGYEALSRGPAGSPIENPEVLFELARDFNLVWELESLCIENIRPFLNELCSHGCLFFNLESQFIQQLQLRGTSVFDSFFECHQNVVIEVTERSAIRDYRTFRRTLHDLKGMGFKIAIDDCGSGYASLEAVAELQPDYLKVGHSLFHGVERDPIRRRLIDLVARCADSIGAKTIAEAIETEEQLEICRSLDIAEGQGFLFARPAPWEQIRDWKPSMTDRLAG